MFLKPHHEYNRKCPNRETIPSLLGSPMSEGWMRQYLCSCSTIAGWRLFSFESIFVWIGSVQFPSLTISPEIIFKCYLLCFHRFYPIDLSIQIIHSVLGWLIMEISVSLIILSL